jgi:hypothetical protein
MKMIHLFLSLLFLSLSSLVTGDIEATEACAGNIVTSIVDFARHQLEWRHAMLKVRAINTPGSEPTKQLLRLVGREFILTKFATRSCHLNNSSVADQLEKTIRSALARLDWTGVIVSLKMNEACSGLYYVERKREECIIEVRPSIHLIDSYEY